MGIYLYKEFVIEFGREFRSGCGSGFYFNIVEKSVMLKVGGVGVFVFLGVTKLRFKCLVAMVFG